MILGTTMTASNKENSQNGINSQHRNLFCSKFIYWNFFFYCSISQKQILPFLLLYPPMTIAAAAAAMAEGETTHIFSSLARLSNLASSADLPCCTPRTGDVYCSTFCLAQSLSRALLQLAKETCSVSVAEPIRSVSPSVKPQNLNAIHRRQNLK